MADQFVGRIPPHNSEAERSVLGILLLSSDKMNEAVDKIKPTDFYNPAHVKIYQAHLNLYNKNAPIDLITAMEELRRLGYLEDVGGMTYVATLTTEVVTTLNLEYYLEIVRDKSILRQIIEVGAQSVDLAYEDSEDVATVMEFTEKGIFDITQGAHSKGLTPIGDVLVESFAMMEERANNPSALTGLTTGFLDLDNKLAGLQKSDLVLLAARPSMGKTALMVNLAVNAAMRANAHVAIFSLEMSNNQLTQRMMSSICHVDLQKVISAKMESEEWTKLLEGLTVLDKLNIHIDDTAGISPLELKAKARRLKAQHGLDLIVIDYLQLMELGGRTENRTQEISAISRNLKAIAKELEVPVVALSQLSRATELRGDKRPILSDLRESGAIEQDADVVMFLYRDEYYNPETEKRNVGEVIIAKHRNGPTGVVELTFLPQFTKFVNKGR
ncbi:MAG: replicative DNA helicase [Neofamilia sp.]